MGTNVDSGTAWSFTLKRNAVQGVHCWWPVDIGPNQWYRLAPSFNQYGQAGGSNAPGVRLQILDEGIYIDANDGTQMAFIDVQNTSPSSVYNAIMYIDMNVLSSPSNY